MTFEEYIYINLFELSIHLPFTHITGHPAAEHYPGTRKYYVTTGHML